MRYLLAALLALLLPATAAAQNFGNIKPGTVLGNPDTTASKPAVPVPMDQVGPGLDVRRYGAVGDGVHDDGPAFRAACADAATDNLTVVVPITLPGYLLKTLDSSGLGAIVVGTGATGTPAKPCHLRGAATAVYPGSVCYTGGSPFLKLGAGLNRPLLYVHKNTMSSLWQDICIDGARTDQTGWAGGPSGKLYTIQIEDDVGLSIDSSLRLDRVVVQSGYNGNLYLGSGRGGGWWKDTWFSYSGQTIADYAVWLQGFDTRLDNVAIGSNAGAGIFFVSGAQYQMADGAIFLNGAEGVVVNGGKVGYLTMSGTNLQANGTHGLRVLNSAPFAGTQVGGHVFSNVTFDGNSKRTTATYSDIVLEDGSKYDRFSNIIFAGNVNGSAPFPKWNVEVYGNAGTVINGVTFGSGTSNTLGFTNDPKRVKTDAYVPKAWTPVLRGDGTAGTWTPTWAVGAWEWGQSSVNVRWSVAGTLAGAAGNMQVAGLPFASDTAANNDGACTVSKIGGWTTGSAATMLSGIVTPNSGVVYLTSSKSGATSGLTPVSEFTGSIQMVGHCVYPIAVFP